MRAKKKISLLITIMVVIVSTVAGITLFVLYKAAVEEEKARLVESAQSQARLIESIASHEQEYSDHLSDAQHGSVFEATMETIRNAHLNFEGFGKTGEFTLAKIEDSNIVFLLRHRHSDIDNPEPVPLSSDYAEPMRLALLGKSGTIVGLDYRGEKVLAAYEPVDILNLGIVAKIDMSEIRSPFIRAGIIAMGVALLLIFLGASMFLRIGNPIVRRLMESEDFSQRLVETANVLIITLDNNWDIVSFNSFAEKLTGYSKDEILGKNWIETFLPEKNNSEIARDIRSIDENVPETMTYESLISTKPGEERLIRWNNSFLKTDDKEIIGILSVGQDITEESKLREELLKSEKLESIGVLAGGIAHDFNNILTAIMGNLNLAKMQSEGDASIQKLLSNAEQAATRAADLTQQMLTFSRGGIPIMKPASIPEIIYETAQFSLRGSNIKAVYNLLNDLHPVELDVGQFSQVINNMVINADQAMPDGGILTISAGNESISRSTGQPLKKGKYVKVSISDQGVGISSKNLRKIFDPFFTTKPKGSGLGLASAYSIIKNHGGNIEVKSELGVGTTFNIYIPASEKKVILKTKRRAKAASGKGRILVVDDEEPVRNLAQAVLKKLGYDACVAVDGNEAITLFRQAENNNQPIDAVILDLTIPGGMGGKEAVSKLQEINPDLKAIVSSGYSNDPIMADFKRHGFLGRVAKPYTMHELSEVLKDVLTDANPENQIPDK